MSGAELPYLQQGGARGSRSSTSLATTSTACPSRWEGCRRSARLTFRRILSRTSRTRSDPFERPELNFEALPQVNYDARRFRGRSVFACAGGGGRGHGVSSAETVTVGGGRSGAWIRTSMQTWWGFYRSSACLSCTAPFSKRFAPAQSIAIPYPCFPRTRAHPSMSGGRVTEWWVGFAASEQTVSADDARGPDAGWDVRAP